MNQASTRSCRRHEWRREGRRTVKDAPRRAVSGRGGALLGGAQRATPGRGRALREPRLGEGRRARRAAPACRPRDERAASGRREGKQRSWGDEKRAGDRWVEEGCGGECGRIRGFSGVVGI